MIVTVDDKGFISVEVFRQFVNVDKIDSYTLDVNDDGSLTLKFYDKNGDIVPHEKKTECGKDREGTKA